MGIKVKDLTNIKDSEGENSDNTAKIIFKKKMVETIIAIKALLRKRQIATPLINMSVDWRYFDCLYGRIALKYLYKVTIKIRKKAPKRTSFQIVKLNMRL